LTCDPWAIVAATAPGAVAVEAQSGSSTQEGDRLCLRREPQLEMLARLDCDVLRSEGIPAGINYAPDGWNPRQHPFEVVVPEAFAERARQLVVVTRQ
jgi:hypothetical protein